jgi:hypothetical protein
VFAAALLLLAAPLSARAAEVTWDGMYRLRGEAFNNLSLSEVNPNAEGAQWSMDQRLRLQPNFLLSDRVSVHTQLDVLPFVRWGQAPSTRIDALTGESVPVEFADAVTPPLTADGAVTPANIGVTRLWAEVETPVGVVKFGRMPFEWGTGMVWNAGNRDIDEFGDTTDRVTFTARAQQVFLMAGFENRSEGYVAQPDDFRSALASVAWATETAAVGGLVNYRWRRVQDEATGDGRFNTVVADLFGEAKLGHADIKMEFAGFFGGGDTAAGANDARLSQFGGNVQVGLAPDKLRAGLIAGFATGDADLADNTTKTFTYDPDFNLSLLLFEEPLPTLAAAVPTTANDGRTLAAARTGQALSNAIFLRPRVGYQVHPTLALDLAWLGAQQAKQVPGSPTGRSYGSEFNLDATYAPFPHFSLRATGALFLPGKHFTDFESDTLGGDFNRSTVAGRLLGTVTF